MEAVATALLFALFAWWAGTASILVAVGLPRRTLAGVVALSLPLLVLAVVAFEWAARTGGVVGVYVGFASAIAIWGWHEFAFLTGALTGPSRKPCPPGARGWRRFKAAFLTLAWHEIALAATAFGLIALAWLDANQTGLWTFLVLFTARISAKLNLFLGVPNLAEELIPAQLAHLKSYFAKRAMNALFPVSITVLTLAVGCFAERAWSAETPAELAEFTLLAALTALALIEHWLLVLPLRDAALWQWMLPADDARRRSVMKTNRAP
ncbi:MAG: putative photosynthetic complex assembly protein PuhE [Pikeienuella sp.]